MKPLTKAQLIQQHQAELEEKATRAFHRGREQGKQEAKETLAAEFSNAKLQQSQAVAKLMEEAGRIMSRAGYMIGKINGDNSR